MLKKFISYKLTKILFFVFAAVLFLLILVGYFYYRNERNYLLSTEEKNLSSISSLKQNQIESWFKERIAEAIYLNGNTFFNESIKNLNIKKNIKDSLAVFNTIYPIFKNHGYRSIFVLDKNNSYLINLNPGYLPDSNEFSIVDSSLKSRTIITSDIMRNEKSCLLFYDIVVPVDVNNSPIAAIIFNIDPGYMIFPYVEKSYVNTLSRESFLFEKEKDSIVIISPLSYNSAPPLSVKYSISRTGLLKAIADKDFKGIVSGTDYRGKEVIADVRKIEGTSWVIVTKQDISEILKPLNFRLVTAGIIIFLILILSGVLIVFYENKHNLQILKKIQDSELKYSELIEQASDGIMIFNRQLKLLEVNSAVSEGTGYSREELLKLSLTDLIEPADIEEKPIQINKLFSGMTVRTERTILRKDKTSFPADISSKKLSSGNILAIFRNITEKKQVESQIKNSERKFRTLFEKSNDPIFIMDNLTIIDCNPATEQLLKLPKSEIVGKTLVDFSPEYQPDGISSKQKAENLLQKVLNGQSQVFDWTNLHGSVLFFVEVNLSLFLLNEKSFIIAVIHNITDRIKFEEDLISAKEKAEEMNRLKSTFLANMSHELRTPLVGILGYSEILSEEIKQPDHLKMIKDIYNSGKRLLETLNSILNLSRIESNKLEIIPSKFNLIDLVLEEINLYKGVAQIKNIYLNMQSPQKEIVLNSDKRIIQNIISNLINNAVKYTLQGGVAVSVTIEINAEKYAVLKITDTGIGIPKESQNVIFDEFRQVSEGFDRKYEGTGLGLTVTKKFVDMLHGTLQLKSEPNIGSEFMVKIPLNYVS